MWFYKLDGVLASYPLPQDARLRRQAAQEFQGKQKLFSQKLQEKCFITVCEITSGEITLAALSLESYNILARCWEFLREVHVSVKSLAAQEITYDVLRSLLQSAD